MLPLTESLDIVVLKDELPAPQSRVPFAHLVHDVASDETSCYQFLQQYSIDLSGKIEKDTVDSLLHVAVEALSNATNHAHKDDLTKRCRINTYIFDDRVIMSVLYRGVGFDPRTLQVTNFDSEGDIFRKYRGRRGTAEICANADKVVYVSHGSDFFIIQHRQAA